MRKGAGKAKGSQFERTICVALSRWVSHGKKEDLFWRSAMSGGRATVGQRSGKDLRRQAGDICAVSHEGHILTDKFYIECRFYKSLDIEAFIIKSMGNLYKFWDEVRIKAASYHKKPMLIAKQNRLPVLVVTNKGCLPCYPLAIVSDHTDLYLFDAMISIPYSSGDLL